MPRSTVSKRIRYNILYLQSNDMERLKPVLIPSIGPDTIEFLETIICSGKCQNVLRKALHSFVLYERNRTVLLQNYSTKHAPEHKEPHHCIFWYRRERIELLQLLSKGANKIASAYMVNQRNLEQFSLSQITPQPVVHRRQFYKFRTKWSSSIWPGALFVPEQ